MKKQVIEQLDSLLDTEREALLTGNFAKIEELLHEKEELLNAWEKVDPSNESGTPVIGKLRRNLRLYDEALAGLRAVAEKIGASTRGRSDLRFYNQDGQASDLSTSHPKGLEKRA
ncbi:flagellar biosynthesis protein FlgN [Roseivivax sp. CAU 1753]